MSNLYQLDAVQAVRAQQAGEISSEELVTDCLERVTEFEDTIQAWVHIDRDHVLEQARTLDTYRRSGQPIGPLHGVPVGIKDIIDTQDYPTELGSPLYTGRKTGVDATAVAMLRQAGAIIMGKTVTTEFAVLEPGKTTNPHDSARTPGGSSSGSAAAVASYMTPLALGSQTNGSVIRPASFCGVVGYKPSFGLISRSGVNRTSRSLDQMGVFARSVEDAALIAQSIIGYDAADPDCQAHVRPDLVGLTSAEPPMPPRFAFVKGPAWDQADAATQEAFAELVEALGDRVEMIDLASVFDEVFTWHRFVMEAEIALNLGEDEQRAGDQMSQILRDMIARGREVHAVDYAMSLDRMEMFAIALRDIFEDFDAILTPSAPGEAPLGLGSTGNPAFCTLWTFAGMPSISLPLLQGEAGMPIGVQLVAARHDDARLMRTANWLMNKVEALANED